MHRRLVVLAAVCLLLAGPAGSAWPPLVGAISLLVTLALGGLLAGGVRAGLRGRCRPARSGVAGTARALRHGGLAVALLVLLTVGGVGVLAGRGGGFDLGAAPAAAQTTPTPIVLLEDTFDAENGGVGMLNYTGFANWNVERGSVDLIGPGFYDFLPGNGLYVDLDGSTSSAGKLVSKTAFPLEAGDYQLQFSLAGSQRGDANSVTVTLALGTVFSETLTLASGEPFTTITRNIQLAAPTSGALSFDHAGGDNLGLLLDNVKFTFTAAQPGFTVSPPNLTFTNQAIESTSADQTVTLTNSGTTAAPISSIRLTGADARDFAQINTCGTGVAAGASCTISVTFRPTVLLAPPQPDAKTGPLIGPRAATLEITESPGTTPRTVAVSGRATPAPLMYVHGLNADVNDRSGFSALFTPLEQEFPQSAFPRTMRRFPYLQDIGFQDATGCPPETRPTTPQQGIPVPTVTTTKIVCDSQSDLGTNVVLLYKDMVDFFNETGRQRKITVVCHSTGCAITRGFLAYAMEMNARDPGNPAYPSALDMVDSVTSLAGVQAGVWGAEVALAGRAGVSAVPNPFVPSRIQRQVYDGLLKTAANLDLDRPAVYSLRPQSKYLEWARQQYPPASLPPPYIPPPYTPALDYFTVYGDMNLVEHTCVVGNKSTSCRVTDTIPIGDILLLPGIPSPYGLPPGGGARFLYNETLGPYNWEWGMKKDIPFRHINIIIASTTRSVPRRVTVSELPAALKEAFTSPEWHLEFGKRMAEVNTEDCQSKGPTTMDQQILKVVKGRLENNHGSYACRP